MPPDNGMSAERKSTRRWLYWGILAWGLSFIIFIAFSGYSLVRIHQVNDALCQVSDDNRTITRNILNAAKRQALESADNIFERNLIRAHYNQLNVLVPPLKCTTPGGPQELEP